MKHEFEGFIGYGEGIRQAEDVDFSLVSERVFTLTSTQTSERHYMETLERMHSLSLRLNDIIVEMKARARQLFPEVYTDERPDL